MSLIVHRQCDICGEEFDDKGWSQWVRLEHFIVHKYDTKLQQTVNALDLTIDCCPSCSAKLQIIVFNKEK